MDDEAFLGGDGSARRASYTSPFPARQARRPGALQITMSRPETMRPPGALLPFLQKEGGAKAAGVFGEKEAARTPPTFWQGMEKAARTPPTFWQGMEKAARTPPPGFSRRAFRKPPAGPAKRAFIAELCRRSP
jgi:hypothetical protein